MQAAGGGFLTFCFFSFSPMTIAAIATIALRNASIPIVPEGNMWNYSMLNRVVNSTGLFRPAVRDRICGRRREGAIPPTRHSA
jgi:hypothetical protein